MTVPASGWVHQRLSINSLSSSGWSFEEELSAWRELHVGYGGLQWRKLMPDWEPKVEAMKASGLRSSTVTGPKFNLGAPQTWDETRTGIATAVEIAVATGGDSVYITPGRSDGRTWRELLGSFREAVEPCVANASRRGVRLAVEPSLRTSASFVNTLRDAIDMAEETGVAIVVDFGNCWMERDRREVLQRAAPHIGLVQICDVQIGTTEAPSPGGRALPGDGELPLDRLMAEVLETGYSGLYDLEVNGPSIEAEGYPSVLRRGVTLASELLERAGVR
jgi:sugar phosphate isomerase/epimerase